MDQQTERFITAFNQIERHLRHLCPDASSKPFRQVLQDATRQNRAVARYARDLDEYADLRNAIVHRYRQDRPIAVPCLEAVADLEAIQAAILSPATVGSLAQRPVACCEPSERVAILAERMFAQQFSQLPVYQGARLVALLTAEAVARWFAGALVRQDLRFDSATIGDVLSSAEPCQNYVLLDANDTVFEALEHFVDYHHKGMRLDAILVTKDGKPQHLPQGIITAADIPRLIRGCDSRFGPFKGPQ